MPFTLSRAGIYPEHMPVAPYEVTAEVKLYPGVGGWHYVTLPADVVDDIRARFGNSARAFGSLAVSVEIGHSEWTTSLFYDNNTASYLLPVKAEVRNREDIAEGDTVAVRLAVKP
jgi:Domain of unknown function (DUF1905)